MLGQVKPDVASSHRDEPGKARLELVLPFLHEPESSVPLDSACRVADTENRYDLLIHRTSTLTVLGGSFSVRSGSVGHRRTLARVDLIQRIEVGQGEFLLFALTP